MESKPKPEVKPLTDQERAETSELYADSCNYISMVRGDKPAHLFYTHFIQALKYKESQVVPLAGVGFTPDTPTGCFIINPRNAKNLNLKQFAGLVVHEICHLVLSHLLIDEFKDPRLRKIANISADMEVNQIVLHCGYDLPEGKGILEDDPEFEVSCCLPETIAKLFDVPCPELNRDYLYYMNWLLEVIKDAKEKRESGEIDGDPSWVDQLIDDLYDDCNHDLWEDLDLSPEERQILERKIAQAAAEAIKHSGGTGLPGSVQRAINKMVERLKPKVNWTRYVRQFVSQYGEVAPYVKRRFNKKDLLGAMSFAPERCVGLVLDTSGSVSDHEYGRFLGEALALSQVHNLDVIVQETSYGNVKPMWRLSEQGVRDFYERNGYGGTNMKPGIQAFLREWDEGGEYRVGGIIVMSDGELGDDSRITAEECHLPLLWVFTRKRDPFKGRPCAGTIIYMESETSP